MYACGKCPFSGSKETCEKHYLFQHMDEKHVPWMCSLCGFRCRTERALNTHKTLDRHRQARARKPYERTRSIKAEDPHEIEIFPSSEDRPYYFSRGNRSQSRNSYMPEYTSREYENADDIRYDDRQKSRGRSRKRKEVMYFEYSHGLNGNDLKRSRHDFETDSSSVPMNESNLGEVHSTTDAGAEEEGSLEHKTNTSADFLGKQIDEMHSKYSNIGLSFKTHADDMNRRCETENKLGPCDEREPQASPDAPQSPPRENLTETSSQNNLTNNMAMKPGDPSLSEDCEESSPDFHEHDNTDDTDDEILGDKVNEIIHLLEPLSNISKALIAIDHHLRRVVPLLEALVHHVPQASTSTTGSVVAAYGSEKKSRS